VVEIIAQQMAAPVQVRRRRDMAPRNDFRLELLGDPQDQVVSGASQDARTSLVLLVERQDSLGISVGLPRDLRVGAVQEEAAIDVAVAPHAGSCPFDWA
jgi:hypothetical protein